MQAVYIIHTNDIFKILRSLHVHTYYSLLEYEHHEVPRVSIVCVTQSLFINDGENSLEKFFELENYMYLYGFNIAKYIHILRYIKSANELARVDLIIEIFHRYT